MTAANDDNQILHGAANETLAPLGLVRKGRSRTWLDDRWWCLGVVEFQPSGFSKGSYLNVGVMWLWSAKDYVSFDYGYRVTGFESSEASDWESTARSLAAMAAARVREIRGETAEIDGVARILDAPGIAPGWPQLHAAIASGLAGRLARARLLLDDLRSNRQTYDWERDLGAQATRLYDELRSPERFRAFVTSEIQRCRAALKLPTTSDDVLEASLRGRAK